MGTSFILGRPKDMEFYKLPGVLTPEISQGSHSMSPRLKLGISPPFQLTGLLKLN